MPSVRELRRKIKSVKATQQITKAMKMVAAARLRRAQGRMMNARPFASKIQDLLADIHGTLAAADPGFTHPMLEHHKKGPRGLLLITADKGLCGSFNTTLIRRAMEIIGPRPEEDAWMFFVAGRKGRDFFRRMGVKLAGEYVNIFNRLSYTHAEMIGEDVTRFFLEQGGREVLVLSNEFKTVLQPHMAEGTLLPLTAPVSTGGVRLATDYIYEPPKAKLLDVLFPRALKARIFHALLESYAAEMGARMAAMDSATRNADELLEALTLLSNKIRQAAITKEISELVGGQEALV